MNKIWFTLFYYIYFQAIKELLDENLHVCVQSEEQRNSTRTTTPAEDVAMYTPGEREEECSNTVIPEVDATSIAETTPDAADLPVPSTVLNDITNVLTQKKVKAVIFHYPKKNSKRGLSGGLSVEVF